MSREINRRPSSETLSVGNVVSAGLRIYRDNFKVYYWEALKSYLWAFVPIYGWAKLLAIQAVIARLAFFEMKETPESLADARRQVMPKLWIFLGTVILQFVIFVTGSIVFNIIVALLGAGFAVNLQSNDLVSVVFSLLTFLLFSRIAFADLAIAINGIREAPWAIGRSWTITEGSVVKIQIIFFIACIPTFMMSMAILLGISFLLPFLLQNSVKWGEFIIWGAVIYLLFSILWTALLIAFLQSIKAVIYYDLLVRKEGLGLNLRDSTNDF
jgi:hypothetical protein